MISRSTCVGTLLYSGIACGVIGIALGVFLDKDTSTAVWLIGGIAGVGFCILTGAAILLAYPEYGAPPIWVWIVFFALFLASVIAPPFGHFDQGGGWIRLAPLYFAVGLYAYKRLFVGENEAR